MTLQFSTQIGVFFKIDVAVCFIVLLRNEKTCVLQNSLKEGYLVYSLVSIEVLTRPSSPSRPVHTAKQIDRYLLKGKRLFIEHSPYCYSTTIQCFLCNCVKLCGLPACTLSTNTKFNSTIFSQ